MKIEELKSNVAKIIDKYVVDVRRTEPLSQARFRASGITDCPRAILFSMMNLPQDQYKRANKDTAYGYKLMRQGTAIHEIVQEYLQGIGVLLPIDTEKVIKDDEYLFSGHCDGVLTLEGRKVLLEIKTINANAFPTLNQPKEPHFYQSQAYMYFLGKVFDYDIQEALVLYVNRNSDNLDMREFWIPRDENVIGIIKNKLKVLKEFYEKGELYPIPEGFTPESSSFTPCKYCPFNTKELCLSRKTKMSDFPGANIIKAPQQLKLDF